MAARTDIDRVAARRCAIQDAAAAQLDGPHGQWRAPWPMPDLRRAPMVGQPVAQGHGRDEPLAARLRVCRLQARSVERRATTGRAADHTPNALSEGDRGAGGCSAFEGRPARDVRGAQARRDAVPQRRDGRFTILWTPFLRWGRCGQAGVQSVSRYDQGWQAVPSWCHARIRVLPATPARPIVETADHRRHCRRLPRWSGLGIGGRLGRREVGDQARHRRRLEHRCVGDRGQTCAGRLWVVWRQPAVRDSRVVGGVEQ